MLIIISAFYSQLLLDSFCLLQVHATSGLKKWKNKVQTVRGYYYTISILNDLSFTSDITSFLNTRIILSDINN